MKHNVFYENQLKSMKLPKGDLRAFTVLLYQVTIAKSNAHSLVGSEPFANCKKDEVCYDYCFCIHIVYDFLRFSMHMYMYMVL